MKKSNLLIVAVSIFILQVVTVSAQTNQNIKVVYTDLAAEKCKTIESSEEEAGSYRGECAGVGGYKLEVLEGDIRQTVNVIAPNGQKSELDLWSSVSTGFSSVGDKAEWRVGSDGKPLAVIIRYNVSEETGNGSKGKSLLVVVKIANNSTCVTDVIQPMANMNKAARKAADDSMNMSCKYEYVESRNPFGEYIQLVEKHIEMQINPGFVVADISTDYNADKPIWKRFSSVKEFEKGEVNSYNTAYVWERNGKIAAVNMTYSSPSGDWVQYVRYIFAEDGSTAKVRRDLRTFMDNIILVREYFYDENGKLLRQSRDFSNLETQKPIKELKNFMDIDVKIYQNRSQLPFASMFSSAVTPGSSMVKINKSWLDKAIVNWNKSGTDLPKPLAVKMVDKDLMTRCASVIRQPANASERAVVSKGWMIYGATQTYNATQVFMALSGFDGMCRPGEYQAFVFHKGKFVGTLSPEMMLSQADGSLWQIRLTSETEITAEYNRYKDTDGLCCPSGTSYVNFEIKGGNMLYLEPFDVITYRGEQKVESQFDLKEEKIDGIGLAKDIEFAKGKTSATYENSVIRGERDSYMFKAKAGQKINISITSLENNAVFDVFVPGSRLMTTEKTKWTAKLPADGSYEIQVGGTRGNATYKITIEVK